MSDVQINTARTVINNPTCDDDRLELINNEIISLISLAAHTLGCHALALGNHRPTATVQSLYYFQVTLSLLFVNVFVYVSGRRHLTLYWSHSFHVF